MKHSPKISIITPSFNQGQYIEKTILSVLNQKYQNLEYIIIDGGSTDNTVDIITKYADRLSYWVSEKDEGQTHAINKGFAKATGEIIAWINSDDMYCDGVLDSIAQFFETNPEASAVVGNEFFMNPEGKIYIRKHPNISRTLERFCMMSILQPSTFLKRKILSDVGYLDERFVMMMDAEWFYRITRIYPFHTINKDISIFRWHKDSKSSSGKGSKLYNRYVLETALILENNMPLLKGFIHRFPKTSFHIHLKIGYLLRYLRRFFIGEINKLNDTNI